MGDGVLVCDRDGCIVLSNPAASRMLKISESSLIGSFLPQCNLHPELAKTIQESLTTRDGSYTSISQELGIGESGEKLPSLMRHGKEISARPWAPVTVLQDISHLKENSTR
jgi:PAS domain-containing protein